MVGIWSPGRTLDDLEKEVILHAYKFYGYNKTKTASSLGIAIRTLDNKLEHYGDAGKRFGNPDGVRESENAGTQGTEIGNGAKSGVCMEPTSQIPKKQSMPMQKR